MTRSDGCVYVFFTRSAFLFVASSMFSRCSRSCRLRTSVSAASARISAWVRGLYTPWLGSRLGAGRFAAASLAASDLLRMSFTMARDDLRTPSSHVTASLSRIARPMSAGSGFTLGALGFRAAVPPAPPPSGFTGLRSGALSAFFVRSLATCTSSSSEDDSSSLKSSSKTSSFSDSDSYTPSPSSSAKASCPQNSSSALSSSSRSLFMRRPRVERFGRAVDDMAPNLDRAEPCARARRSGRGDR